MLPIYHHNLHPITFTAPVPNTIGRGKINIGTAQFPTVQDRLPSDPIGRTTLTVSGILPGAEVRFFVNGIGEVDGGVESATNTSMTFNINYYTSVIQGYLVILLPGYQPVRVPMQVSINPLAYTYFPNVDPAYLT